MTEAERAALPDIAETLKKAFPVRTAGTAAAGAAMPVSGGPVVRTRQKAISEDPGEKKRSSEVPVRRFRGSFAFRHYLDRDQLVGETLESMCMPMPAVWAETSEAR